MAGCYEINDREYLNTKIDSMVGNYFPTFKLIVEMLRMNNFPKLRVYKLFNREVG